MLPLPRKRTEWNILPAALTSITPRVAVCPHWLRAEVVLGSGCLVLTPGQALGGTEIHCTIPYILPKSPFLCTAVAARPHSSHGRDLGSFQFYTFLNPVPARGDGTAGQGAFGVKGTKKSDVAHSPRSQGSHPNHTIPMRA